ncbi:copper amine oxidase N-terminal domain-containing protein [Paenibacillus chibensis]|uniref:Copper amine oxidase N-terminal domain-containing protein n=1 Tax=Paenibacillus chibensis TaxID=59846 RepID=A0ABU6PT29_9BACL|nr:copper amine oxidase N-terminal domain-containing protein [Paenibacillus chibensis]
MRTTSRAASFAAVWGLAVLLATTPLFNGSAPAAAASSSSVQQNEASISVTLNGNEFTPGSAPFMERGSVYLPLRDIGELLGTIVYWDASSKTVSMTYPERVIKVKPGAAEAEVNGKKIKLTAPVKIVNGRVYVPLRFFSEAIGAGVDWNSSKRRVAITHATEYVKGGGVNLTVWLNRKTGDIYTAYPFEAVPVASGKLNVDLQEFVNIDAQYLNGGGIMVYVTDNYGEPHVHTAVYTAFIKNKQIVKQTNAKYFQRYKKSVYTFKGKPALHDGKTLTLLDENGMVTKEYNLQELGGKDEVYSVLTISDKYLLIRPNTTGLLTLINLKDNSATLLYKELLTPEEQEYSERNDVPYYGDELNFDGESPVGTLNFSYYSPFSSKERQLKYVMK